MTRSAVRRSKRKEPSKFGAYFMTALMVFLMIASIAGVMVYAPPRADEFTYGDYTFRIDKQRSMYVAELDGKEFAFNNLPYTALSVPFLPELMNLKNTAQFFVVTFDPALPSDDLLYTDFVRLQLYEHLGILGAGVMEPSDTYPLPVITCANATQVTPVIELRVASAPSLSLEGSCIVLEGNRTSLLLAKDAFLYQYHGILGPEDLLKNGTG